MFFLRINYAQFSLHIISHVTRFFISNMNMENIMGLPSMLIQAADRDGAAPTPISELDDTDKVPHMISVFGPKGI